jgi:iron complex transport system ATP-binding protein
METIFKVNQLTIGYDKGKYTDIISKNISFELGESQLTALVGANGIGKSTLLKTLTQIETPLSGEMCLYGRKIQDYTTQEISKLVSVVWANNPIQANLTVFDLVALGRHPYTNWIGMLTKTDARAIEEALTLTHCLDISHKKCYEISDGQLQKAMIARSLAQHTPVIILDEPTTHLDVYHKVFILKLLKKLAAEQKKTILFSTHEIDMAIQVCDQMILMKSDKVVSGEPCELIENHEFSAVFPSDLVDFNESTGRFTIK